MKFIHSADGDAAVSSHWEDCNRDHKPFITIRRIDNAYSEIFYDITDIAADCGAVSTSITHIIGVYHEFFLVPAFITDNYTDQWYYFSFPVHSAHAEFIAASLFDYLDANLDHGTWVGFDPEPT